MEKKKSPDSRDRQKKHNLDKPPKGTPEELEWAMSKALEHQVKILDYSDKEEFPDEVLEEQKRLLHYGVRGPRRGYYVSYGRSKLWQADVLYILTVTLPSKYLASKYDVSEALIRNIRGGKLLSWKYEYDLIKRIKTAVRHHIRQIKIDKILYGIHNKEGRILHLVTSKRKAKVYMDDLYDWKAGYYVEKVEVLT